MTRTAPTQTRNIEQPESATAVAQTLDTSDGPFSMIARPDGAILASGWTDDLDLLTSRIATALRPETVMVGSIAAADAVTAYYEGDLSAVENVLVAQTGGDFRLRGWSALRKIAPGHPLTYRQFAEALGKPTAVRAAASVCATNAPALFVPCHRVLRTDGTMGGFAWGVDVKRSLLTREATLTLR